MTAHHPTRPKAKVSFHSRGESSAFGARSSLNLYPDTKVVDFVQHCFAAVPDRVEVGILELGFGGGENVWFLAREGFAAAGIEVSQAAVAAAQDRLRSEGLQADLRSGDYQSLPWADGRFDAVIDHGALAHNRRAAIARSLDEVRRVLKPGGYLRSVAYGAAHPARLCGKPLGDGSFHAFSEGCFADSDLAFFATAADLDELYGGRFALEIRDLELLEDQRQKTASCRTALWHLTCRKAPGLS